MSETAKPVSQHTKEAEQYLRAAADLENTRKRLQREHQELIRYAAEAVLRELLPIVDSLGQALIAVDKQSDLSAVPPARAERSEAGGGTAQAGPQAVVKGVHLIYRQLLGLLEKEGVARIPTIGERFDPHRHEAVAQVETQDHAADGTIVEEVQAGYTMHGKVLRPAMVRVAKSRDQKTEDRSQTKDRSQASDQTEGSSDL